MFKVQIPLAVSLFLWRVSQGFSQQFLQFIFSIILARLLGPQAFGEIAMLIIFISLSNVFIDGGFSLALVQKKEVSNIHYTSVFVFNLALSILLYGCIYIAAPYVGEFYNDLYLKTILRVLALKLIISSFNIAIYAKMVREFKQKEIAYISFTSLLLSYIVGIIIAYLSYGVWSLVFQQLSFVFLQSLFYIITSPGLVKLRFKLSALTEMCKFSTMTLCTDILNTIFENIYSIVFGRYFNPNVVGFLNRAKALNDLPSKNFMMMFIDSQTSIVFRQQDDNNKVVSSIRFLVQICVFVIYPIVAIMFIFAPQIILILLGNNWLPAAVFLKILCFCSIFQPLIYCNNMICTTKGRADYVLKTTILTNTLIVLSMFCLFNYGIVSMLVGQVICLFLSFITISSYSSKLIGYGIIKQVNDIKAYLISTAVMVLFMIAAENLLIFKNAFLQLLVIVPSALSVYLIIIFFIKRETIKAFINLRNKRTY